jgi:DNA polymerase-1
MFDEHTLAFIAKLLECRGNTKNLSTYVVGFLRRQRGGIIYPSFKLTGAVTGRLSTPGAGIMVIPRDPEYRRMVIPKREGHVLVKPDFGQLEARVVAFLSGDERMVDAFQPNRPDFFTAMMPSVYPDLDISTLNKAQLKEKRNGVKPFSHGLNYGRGPEAIAEELGMPIEEAKRIAKNYLGDPEKGLMAWQSKIKEMAFGGEEMFTPYGLHLQQELVTSRNRSAVANNALAFNPQSIGNSICVDALMHIMEWIGEYGDAHIFGTVHDQILGSIPIEYALEVGSRMQYEMEEAGNRFAQGVLIFEAEAEFGFSWPEELNPEQWKEYLKTAA